MWGLCWKCAAEAAFSKVIAGVHLIRSVAATISFYVRINGFSCICVSLGFTALVLSVGVFTCTDYRLLKTLYDCRNGNNLILSILALTY